MLLRGGEVGSPATKYNLDAMETCRQKIATEAGQVGAIGDGFGKVHIDSNICGELPSAGQLTSAVSKADSTMQSEFRKAEDLLNNLNSSIGKIMDVVQHQDTANAQSLRGAH